MEGEVLFVVLVADGVLEFDFFEDLFGDGGIVAVGRVIVAQRHLLCVVVLPHNDRVYYRHQLLYTPPTIQKTHNLYTSHTT